METSLFSLTILCDSKQTDKKIKAIIPLKLKGQLDKI